MSEENKDTVESKDDGKMMRITKEADQAVLALLHRISATTENVRITKSALASYIIEWAAPKFGDADIKTLYMQSVSEVDLLRNALKQATETGVIPENLREILFENAGLTPSSKKTKKPRRSDGINDTIHDKDVA